MPKLAIRGSLVLLLLATAAAPASAQREFDIHVAEIAIGASSIEITSVRNATDRPGYDNQPWFTRDGGSILYARMDDGETDIFRYDLDDAESTRVTDAPEWELSPSTLDGSDDFLAKGGGADPEARGLWRYSPSGEPLGPFMEPMFNPNYYGVADSETVLGWLYDDGNGTLVWADRSDGSVVPIRDRVAPSPPQAIPGETAMSIVEPNFLGRMWIKRLDLETREITPIVEAAGDGDGFYYAWTPDGRILMPDGEAIFVRDPDGPDEWDEVARFPGIGEITRIVLSPTGTHLAFVTVEP